MSQSEALYRRLAVDSLIAAAVVGLAMGAVALAWQHIGVAPRPELATWEYDYRWVYAAMGAAVLAVTGVLTLVIIHTVRIVGALGGGARGGT